MSRFSWYEVTVREGMVEVSYPEFAVDEQEAVANFRSRGEESERAEVVRVALEKNVRGHVARIPD